MKTHWNWNPERGSTKPYPRCLRKPLSHYTATNLALDANGKTYQMTDDKDKVTCARCQRHLAIVTLLSDPKLSENQVRQLLKWEAAIKYSKYTWGSLGL